VKLFVSCCVLAAVLLSGGAPAAQEQYTLDLSRAFQADTRFHFRADAESSRRTVATRKGAPLRDEGRTLTVALDGTVHIDAVNEAGAITAAHVEVDTFSAAREGVALEGLKAGQTLTLRVEDDETRFVIDEQAPAEDLAEALKLILDISASGTRDKETFLNPPGPVAEGDTWPVDRQATAAAMSQEQMQVTPEAVSGSMRLVDVREEAGETLLRVAGELEIAAVEIALPRMTQAVDSKVAVIFRGDYPADAALPPRMSERTTVIHVNVEGTLLLSGVLMTITEERRSKSEWRPLDAAAETPADAAWKVLSIE